ncbi:hypothetical protein MTR67_002327 [Solanum verrucosum]|uniref:Uncharacterized protein n=1 Tax=Solanum verrucosum TaxID=315347 RepID=A0AAF0PQS5_SOLVR|nr:hypothetical protein MTR67_002327 [Solanum verrucosum]
MRTPILGQTSCQGNLKMCMEEACPRRGLAPPLAKYLVHVADMSRTLPSQNLIMKLVGTLLRRKLVPRQNM